MVPKWQVLGIEGSCWCTDHVCLIGMRGDPIARHSAKVEELDKMVSGLRDEQHESDAPRSRRPPGNIPNYFLEPELI